MSSNWGFAPVAQFTRGPSCGQNLLGACRSKGLVAVEHVPDRFGEFAGDVEHGDLAAAFAAVAVELASEDGLVGGVAAGGLGGLHQRPPQVVGSVLSERTAPVALAGLVDLRAQPRVADELDRRGKARDVAELARDREGEDPADSGTGQQEWDVAV